MKLLKTIRTPENTYIDVELYPPKINFVYVKSEFYNKRKRYMYDFDRRTPLQYPPREVEKKRVRSLPK